MIPDFPARCSSGHCFFVELNIIVCRWFVAWVKIYVFLYIVLYDPTPLLDLCEHLLLNHVRDGFQQRQRSGH